MGTWDPGNAGMHGIPLTPMQEPLRLRASLHSAHACHAGSESEWMHGHMHRRAKQPGGAEGCGGRLRLCQRPLNEVHVCQTPANGKCGRLRRPRNVWTWPSSRTASCQHMPALQSCVLHLPAESRWRGHSAWRRAMAKCHARRVEPVAHVEIWPSGWLNVGRWYRDGMSRYIFRSYYWCSRVHSTAELRRVD